MPNPLTARVVERLRRDFLRDIAVAELEILRELDIPLMRMVAALPEEQLLTQVVSGIDRFLGDLLAGRAVETAREAIKRWETGELEGIDREAITPLDIIGVYSAQKRAIVAQLPRCDLTVEEAVAFTDLLLTEFMAMQHLGLEAYDRIHRVAVAQRVRAEAEKASAEEHAARLRSAHEELRSVHEELQATHEELQASNEELQTAHEELQTAHEELQAVNEELTSQGEELQAQQEEIADMADQLRRRNEEVEAEVLQRTAELAAEKRFLQALIDAVPLPMAYLDPERSFKWSNAAWQRFWPDGTLGGKTFEEVFPAASAYQDGLRQALASGHIVQTEGVLHHATIEGQAAQTYWDATIVPIESAVGGVEGVLVILADVTTRLENARLQGEKIAALERADMLKDQFLAMVSHELRTPINAITGFGSILQDEVAGTLSPVQHAYLARMLRGADMLLMLVDDLLDMSRIQAGKFALELGPMSCEQAVEKVAQMLQPLAEQRRHTIRVDIGRDDVSLMADERRIGQVLFNLLHNAIKFTPEGGEIVLRSRTDGEFLRFEVEDTGPGIPETEAQRVFERFEQLDMSSTRATGGAGLGLAISKALVEAHGGEIGILPGRTRGALVWFKLPLESGSRPLRS